MARLREPLVKRNIHLLTTADLACSANFYALAAFNEKFGQYYPNIHQYQVSAGWQSALSLSGTIGNWVGYFYGAWIVDKIGYRKALMINYVLIIPLIGSSVESFKKGQTIHS